jgi:hypothetical protein
MVRSPAQETRPLPPRGGGTGRGGSIRPQATSLPLSALRAGCGGLPPPAPPCHLLTAQKVAENAPSQRRWSLGGGKRGVFHEAGKPRGVKPFAASDGGRCAQKPKPALTSARDVSSSPPRGGAVRGRKANTGVHRPIRKRPARSGPRRNPNCPPGNPPRSGATVR